MNSEAKGTRDAKSTSKPSRKRSFASFMVDYNRVKRMH